MNTTIHTFKRQAGRQQVKIKFHFLKTQFTAKVNLFWFPFLKL